MIRPIRPFRDSDVPVIDRVTENNFAYLHSQLEANLAKDRPIQSSSLESIINLISSAGDADRVLDLMLRDAEVKEKNDWNWEQYGYGQLLLFLVEAGVLVGNLALPEALLRAAPKLHTTPNSVFFAKVMRRVAADRNTDMSAVLQRLLVVESEVVGSNSGECVRELLRVLRRFRHRDQVVETMKWAEGAGIVMRESFVEDTRQWLAKHG